MMLYRFIKFAWASFVALLVTVAVLLSVARIWVPTLAGHRAELETVASELLHKTVTIQRLDATWRGLSPVLKLQGVRIMAPADQDVLLDIEQVWVALDLWALLRDRHPEPAGISLIGTRLPLRMQEDGSVRLRGFTAAAPLADVFAWVLAQPRLSLLRSTVDLLDSRREGAALHFSDVNLTLVNTRGHHLLKGRAQLPAQLGARLDVEADLGGRAGSPRAWAGMVYVKGKSLALNQALAPWLPGKPLPEGFSSRGTGDVRLWIEIDGSRPAVVSTEFDIHDLSVRYSDTAARGLFEVDRIGGQFGWRATSKGWQVAVRRLKMRRGEREWKDAAFSLAAAEENGHVAAVSGVFDYVDLDDATALLLVLPYLDATERRHLGTLSPVGRLEDLHVSLERESGALHIRRVRARFFGLGFSPWLQYPGMTSLDGAIEGTPQHGGMVLDAGNVAVEVPRMLRAPIVFETVNGRLYWQRYRDRLRVGSEELTLRNADLTASAALIFDMPSSARGTPNLDMRIDIAGADMSRINRYLPALVMPVSGVEWLDRAFAAGRVTTGSVLFHGSPASFPFDAQEGRFEARLEVRDATLDYHPGWRPLTNVSATVQVQGRSITVQSHGGAVGGASLGAVTARIPDLEHPHLTVDGRAQGEINAMLAFLYDSPLEETYGGVLERIEGSRAATLMLHLDLPLTHGSPPLTLEGTLLMAGNGLHFVRRDISLQDISGSLRFTTDGMEGEGLKARLLDTDVTVDVATKEQAGKVLTEVTVVGPLDLLAYTGADKSALADRVSGQSPWRVIVRIPRPESRDDPIRGELEVSSTLRGTSIDLPEPLGKAAGSARPLVIRTELTDRDYEPVRIRYGDELKAILKQSVVGKANRTLRCEVHFGPGEPELPASEILRVRGRLASVSLAQWEGVMASMQGAGAGGPPVELDLEIAELELFSHILRDVAIHSRESDYTWKADLSGPTIAGQLDLELGKRGLESLALNLTHLYVESENSPKPDTRAQKLDPTRIPELQVTTRKLVYDGIDLGQFDLQTARNDRGVKVNRLIVSSDMLSIYARGDWRVENARQVSTFDIDLEGGDLGMLLDAFGYKENVAGGELGGSIRANWAGAPTDFALDRLQGKLSLSIKDGVLLNVEPGAGRVFGLLSLQTLPRRLSMDLSDLFEKGYSFDSLEGDFTLVDGDAFTNNLYIDGPSARIEISGRVGLADQDYDEFITVIPHVRSTLPIAGVVAGGPIVGAVMLFAEQIFSDQLDKMTSFTRREYLVTGPWEDPVFEQLQSPASSEDNRQVLPEEP